MSSITTKNPMRIAHVTATFPPYQGGTGNICFYQARELARLGHQVDVFSSSEPGAQSFNFIHGFGIYRLQPFLRIGNAPVLPQLLRLLQGYNLIHLHCPFITGAELTFLAAVLHRIPLVVTYHSDLIKSGTWRDNLFAIASRSSSYILGRADRVLFVSEGHARACVLKRIFFERGEKCQVLPNGIDIDLFRPSLDLASKRAELQLSLTAKAVGCVGALDQAHHYTGLDVLLESISCEDLGEVDLLVVGDGDLKAQYERQAVEIGLEQRVNFLGRVSHELLPSIYQACDVVAMPSTAPESFGLVAAEALACEVPVVASDWPGVRSLVRDGETGLLVRAGDSAELAKNLSIILRKTHQERQAMGLVGRRHVKAKHDWRQIGGLLNAIYGEVIAEYHQAPQRKKAARFVP